MLVGGIFYFLMLLLPIRHSPDGWKIQNCTLVSSCYVVGGYKNNVKRTVKQFNRFIRRLPFVVDCRLLGYSFEHDSIQKCQILNHKMTVHYNIVFIIVLHSVLALPLNSKTNISKFVFFNQIRHQKMKPVCHRS